MHILGIDYGSKRIGLAWADSDLGLVLPFGLIEQTGDHVPRALVDLITEDGISQVVIGLPHSLQDHTEETNHMKKIRAFGDLLGKETGVPIVYADERFSSQQADHTHGDVSRDEKSAMIILEGFLSTKK